MRRELQKLSFEDALPLLVSTYHHGKLVPFIGAGMSAPLLNLWEPFVECLEKKAQITHDPRDKQAFDMRAQRAGAKVRNRCGDRHFHEAVRQALKNGCSHESVPKQTLALAAIRWPLVISTNYDDLYYGACRAVNAECELTSEVVGRSPMDCKRVVSSLTGPFDREYIWHIQGFLGGQYPDTNVQNVVKPQLDELQKELVIGHAEYRLATNTAVHFRRCFGAVFQTRSLLFLGSNLTEPYFMNLFGEVLDLCGPSSVPHFAFTTKGAVDRQFLAEQMNITVCEFEEDKGFTELPDWLDRLKGGIDCPKARTRRYSYGINTDTDLEVVPGTAPCSATAAREAIALVAHKDPEGMPIVSNTCRQSLFSSRFPDARFADSSHVLRYGDSEFYAVSARDPDSQPAGDGSAVHTAAWELLNRVVADGFRTLHLDLPQSGGTVPPVYAFIEAVRSYGLWKKQNTEISLDLILHAGKDVMLNLTSNRIDIRELLTSKLTRFWAVVTDTGKAPLRRALYYDPQETRLEAVLSDLLVPCSDDWLISVRPSRVPDGVKPGDRTTRALSGCTLVDIGVVFGSILAVDRPNEADCQPDA